MYLKLIKLIKIAPIILGISLFIGFTIIGAGIGAFVPSINTVSAPFICPGKIQIESRNYSYKPGQRGVEHKIYCERRGGELIEDITFYSFFISSIIYSLILFPILMIGISFIVKNKKSLPRRRRSPNLTRSAQTVLFSNSSSQRLKELNELKQSGLITPEEYESKRNEILGDL